MNFDDAIIENGNSNWEVMITIDSAIAEASQMSGCLVAQTPLVGQMIH